MFIATLVAKDRLDAGDISAACDAVRGTAGAVVDGVACDVRFLCSGEGRSPDDATDVHGSKAPASAGARAALEAALPHLDIIIQREPDRHRKLLIADMDSTMITVECIDELADYVGLKAQVSDVTERAMRGELDFAEALGSRVALLAGLSEATVAECLRERVKLMGGAVDLITAFKAAGGRAVLVSGGFTHFTDSVAQQIGFDRAIANHLVVQDGKLTGEVEFPIVDAQTKRETLLAEATALGIPINATLAIGDGANDIPMIEAAGLGIAYHAKPKTEAAADASVRFGDLNVVRYALGLD
ncbi:phosphoserine phosphatase SerB [Sphingomonas sp. SUN039]|nr:phosphoserine phosphatase SerB [Sphingomonas sp. SUN039]UVO53893.1 phosphoserine phosphatase SerB [Sphingomonas sp. SUN039]